MTSAKPLTLLAVWLLTLALLLSQTLGLVHGVLHAPVQGSPYGVTQAVAVDTGLMARADVSPPPAVKGWLASLFSSHNSGADCRLYDQASHGSAALHVVSLALPVVLPPLAVAIFQGEALARWAALFDARGPPLTS
ncbi:MAG: hypothetical protein ABIP46_14425 [Polaromonas sp.]